MKTIKRTGALRMFAACVAALIAVSTAVPHGSQGGRIRVRSGVGTTAGLPPGDNCVEGEGPITTGVHPRMLYNDCTSTTILSKIRTGGVDATRFQALIDQMKTDWTTMLSCSTTTCFNYAANVAFIAMTFGSVTGADYSGSASYDTQAEWYAQCVDVVDRARTLNGGTLNASIQGTGLGSEGYALALDWCWDGMSSGERSTHISWLKSIEAQESSTPCITPTTNLANTGQYSSCYATMLMSAVAAYNETTEATWVNAHYAYYDDEFRGDTGYIWGESTHIGTTGGDSSESYGYGNYYAWIPLVIAEESWRTAHGITKSAHYDTSGAEMFKGWPRLILNSTYPYDENAGNYVIANFYRFAQRETLAAWYHQMQAHIAQGLFEGVDTNLQGLAKWLEGRTGTLDTTGSIANRNSLMWILLGPSAAPSSISPDTLGLPTALQAGDSRYFFREDYDSVDGVGWVMLSAPKWNARHYYIFDPGPGGTMMAFDGPLETRAGDDSNGHSPGGIPGGASGFAFPDRSITVPADKQYDDNSQGTLRRSNGTEWRAVSGLTTGSTFNTLDERRNSLATGSDTLSAVMLDMSAKGVDQARATTYIRNTGVSIQSDRAIVVHHTRWVTTSTNYVPTEIVHGVEDFTVSGSVTTPGGDFRIPSSCPTSGGFEQCASSGHHGYVTYSGVTAATMTNTTNGSAGKLWVTPKGSPDGVKVGGPDSDSSASFNATGQYSMECTDLYGVRHPCSSYSGGSQHYASEYRLEFTESTTRTAGTMMIAKEATASGGSQGTVTYYTNGAGMNDFDCASVGNVGWCWGEDDEDKTSGDAIFTGLASVTKVIKWCGLPVSAARTFTKGSNIASITHVLTSDTDLTFTSDAGGCMLLSIVFAGSASDAGNTITVAS